MDDIVEILRSFGQAYPEEIFSPLTDEEQKQMGALLDRASGAMGRHCAKFMAQGADEIEQLRARNEVLERQLADETALREASTMAARKFEEFMLKEKARAEQAEQRIAESQRQEPVAWGFPNTMITGKSHVLMEVHIYDPGYAYGPSPWLPLYLSPIVPPDVEEAVKVEREACAKICESECVGDSISDGKCGIADMAYNEGRRDCASAIRARGGK